MEADVVFRRAAVIDGSGAERYTADVAVCGGKIAAIGRTLPCTAAREIAADGRVLAPGFIDMHGHSDLFLAQESALRNKLEQGITCEVSGQCGLSPAPVCAERMAELEAYVGYCPGDGLRRPADWPQMDKFNKYLNYADSLPLGIHMAFLLGQGTVRLAGVGATSRAATGEELRAMERMVAEAMESGARGLTTGLIYAPGVYTPRSELVALCRVAARYGGIYASHIRNESDGVESAVREALEIGRLADIPVEISHHKISGRRNWGKSDVTLALIDEANRHGQPAALDLYPYCAGATHLFSALPPRWQEGGVVPMLHRLRETKDFTALEQEILHPQDGWNSIICDAGWDGVCVTEDGAQRTIPQLAQAWQLSPVEALVRLILESNATAPGIFFMAQEQEMTRILCHSRAMIGTDAGAAIPQMGAHPRIYGTFPRVLGRYVREQQLLTLEAAIHKMTGMPAQWAKLTGKGFVREGYDADLVLFAPDTIRDGADYDGVPRANTGIEAVLVDGKIAVWQGKATGVCAGRVLR